MTKHFKMIVNLTTRFGELTSNPIGTREQDLFKISELIVHSADLAHPTKIINVYS